MNTKKLKSFFHQAVESAMESWRNKDFRVIKEYSDSARKEYLSQHVKAQLSLRLNDHANVVS